ncbi:MULTISPECIES: helix-turn-helix domain-containing protein [Sphingomonas]|jgi:transcriptional regulator with XRE-family HTH domain|uniref:helix-turn-helix domain-containing protein n=1 Tax=Sphingomonas TaxID=13687 RepID=UPI0004DF72EB|nr:MULTISPECIES: helix-turn-helix transcriptional regulator [Sphingomonas]KQN21814.1 XRE family transcriptional regulator [Sphingomonas sp. Leaf30]MBD8551089.1 helix-turn-helix transcriptional regulator [Sphingomonas sp. CFBP 8764]MBD8698727.1 helix-turn-helix transcriptional regulator [Sphingomonas sp. CFBP 13714]MBP2514219.1 transcriptional regulator with XRE-family HTH domain [Sphingomonas sp. PvP018]MDY1009318.1 helix-turn-helix transcriptional regulator [Sphingomonas sp. CFBP9019]
MITAIRAVRRAKGLTLDDVARRCDPPTTAQTIGRLETGTRTVSVGWLNRIAAALDVAAVDLVTMPERADLPVVAILDSTGIQAPTRPNLATPPHVEPGQVAVTVAAGVGDYRTGDVLWCTTLGPDEFESALYRDVLVPRPAGRFAFGRLVALTDGSPTLIPVGDDAAPQQIERPVWIARAVRLIRTL